MYITDVEVTTVERPSIESVPLIQVSQYTENCSYYKIIYILPFLSFL